VPNLLLCRDVFSLATIFKPSVSSCSRESRKSLLGAQDLAQVQHPKRALMQQGQPIASPSHSNSKTPWSKLPLTAPCRRSFIPETSVVHFRQVSKIPFPISRRVEHIQSKSGSRNRTKTHESHSNRRRVPGWKRSNRPGSRYQIGRSRLSNRPLWNQGRPVHREHICRLL
jgi:hypothetical protein